MLNSFISGITRKEKERRHFWQDLKGLGKLWPFLRHEKAKLTVAALLIPVISILQMAGPLILKNAVDHGILVRDFHQLGIWSFIFLAAVLSEYGARAVQSLMSGLCVHQMIRDMRRFLVNHLLHLPLSFHDHHLSGTLVTRATGDFDNLSESLNQGVLTSIVDIAVLLGTLAGMYMLEPRLAAFATLFLPLLWMIVTWFSNRLKSAMLAARQKIAVLNGFTQECFFGQSTIKLLTAEGEANSTYHRLNVEFRDAQMGSVVLDAWLFAVLEGIASVTIGIILWLIVRSWHAESALSAGVLVAFVQYVQQLFEPLKQLANKMAMLQGAFTSIERIFDLLARREKIPGERIVNQMKGQIVFAHVNFSYGKANGTSQPVLSDVSFALDAGKSLALVGETGGGKSTIVKLLAKLYSGYQGQIFIDGQDLLDIDGMSLRSFISIVPQDIALFDGSIAFNIGLDRPGIAIDDIKLAAVAVGADSFIRNLPGEYDFTLREQGSNLSHGERQLLIFARALAKNPSIVILDEATASVDARSEELIQQGTDKMLRGRTTIVIAHRLSTITRCDQILVIAGGRILEAGDHQGLIQKHGVYYKLYHSVA